MDKLSLEQAHILLTELRNRFKSNGIDAHFYSSMSGTPWCRLEYSAERAAERASDASECIHVDLSDD